MVIVQKRNGNLEAFERRKLEDAIIRAMSETVKGIDSILAMSISMDVANQASETGIITTDNLHDLVEMALMNSERKDVAKAYILWRDSKPNNNPEYILLDDEFIDKYRNRPSNMSPLGEFVYYRTYSRYLPKEGRREYWWETCRRAVEYNCSLVNTTKGEAQRLFDNMYNMRQFLSGRTIWVGGTPVSKRHPMSNFNCAFETIEELDSFSDLFYLLMLGSGVGVRILKEDVSKLPSFRTGINLINKQYEAEAPQNRHEHTSLSFKNGIATIKVGDSKNGWVDSLKYYLQVLSDNQYDDIHDVVIDYDSVRPNGEKLKTFGGTASGHDALKDIFQKITKIITRNNDFDKYKLKPIDCLDICNIIGEGVVVGGRR